MKKIPLTPLIPLQVFSETPGFEFSLTTFLVISEFAGRSSINPEGARLSHSHPFYLNPAEKTGSDASLANAGNQHQLKVSGNIPNMLL